MAQSLEEKLPLLSGDALLAPYGADIRWRHGALRLPASLHSKRRQTGPSRPPKRWWQTQQELADNPRPHGVEKPEAKERLSHAHVFGYGYDERDKWVEEYVTSRMARRQEGHRHVHCGLCWLWRRDRSRTKTALRN